MLRMHDHLKYPYFVAFYENRVKVGLRPNTMFFIIKSYNNISNFVIFLFYNALVYFEVISKKQLLQCYILYIAHQLIYGFFFCQKLIAKERLNE
ncbi:MAG: hypothetical protein STSR0002_08840 [Smithella sp.]